MAVAKELLDVLVCVESKKPLIYFPDGDAPESEQAFLFCIESRLKYPVSNDIPIMLLDEADRVDEAAASKLVARAKELGL